MAQQQGKYVLAPDEQVKQTQKEEAIKKVQQGAAQQGAYTLDSRFQNPPENPLSAASALPDSVKSGVKSSLSLDIDPTSLASQAAGAAVGAATENPLAYSVTQATVDRFLRNYKGETSSNPVDTAIDIGKNAVYNEIFGRLLNSTVKGGVAVSNYLKEKANPGSVIDDSKLLNLKPTGSQILRSQGSAYSRAVGQFEDLLAPASKNLALENSFNAAKDEGDKFLEDLTGRKGLKLTHSETFASTIKEGEEGQFVALKQASNARGENAKLIAEQNPKVVQTFENQPSGLVDANGRPILKPVLVKETQINGPIDYKETIQAAKKLQNDIYNSNINPDPDSPTLKAVNDILAATNAKFDKNGTLISYDPVSFGSAWKDKQISGAIGYGTPMTDVSGPVDARFKTLEHAIDNDIERSIPSWEKGSQEALSNFQQAKLIVQKRNALLTPVNESGKSIDTLINTVTKPTNTLNTIFDDYEKTSRFLKTGTIAIPEETLVTGANGGVSQPIRYISSNARKDAQGYTLMRFLNDATVPSAVEPTKNVFDANKLMSVINDPNRQENLRQIFGSEGLSNVKQFFKNIAFTSEKSQNVGASRYLAVKLGSYGVALGPGIATALTTGSIPTSAVVGGTGITLTVGAHGLARALTNPESARVLIAMAQGGPLNMSTQLASRIVANSLRNQPVTLSYGDGTSVDGKIDKFGKFSIPLNLDFLKGKQ